MAFVQWCEASEELTLSVNAIDGVLQCVRLKREGTKGLPSKLSLAAKYVHVPLDTVRRFVYHIWRNFTQKCLNRIS